ncbi:hypothetical protein ACO0RG_003828 [Hanseniaspora osmophila]
MSTGDPGKTPSHNRSTLPISPGVKRMHPRMGSAQKLSFQTLGASSNAANLANPGQNTSHISNLKTPSKNSFYNARLRNFSNSSTQKVDISAAGDASLTDSNGLLGNNSFAKDIKLSAAEKLRLWRHDALMQHQYITAEFIGDKVFSITKDPNDAFWLAQVYYSQGFYIKTVDFLEKNGLDATNIICQYLCGLALYQLEKYEDALNLIGETNPFKDEKEGKEPENITANFEGIDAMAKNELKSSMSGTKKNAEVSAEVLLNNKVVEFEEEEDEGIKLESSLCLLRGKIYLALNNLDMAKVSLKEACMIDVKNFESFQILVDNYYLSPDEQMKLYDSLPFQKQIVQEDEQELVKSFYCLKLSNYLSISKTGDQMETSEKEQRIDYLKKEYTLSSNADVLANEVDRLFVECNFGKCLQLCEFFVKQIDKLNFKVLVAYVSCLYELNGKNKLFQLAHRLVESCPKHAVSWYAVASYHLATNKIGEARKYFSKSAVLDPNLLCSWIGFGHTYAAEGEHEQAILVYSTSARLFPGSHLPNLFLGMQHILLDSLSLAESYFEIAVDICPYDPLLLNEMGVVYYQKGNYSKAKVYFKRACEMIERLNSITKSWVGVHVNLGHTYRKLDDPDRALRCFNQVLQISKKDDNVYTSIGLIFMKLNKLERAIDILHKALVIQPANQIAQDLLNKAIELNMSISIADPNHPLNVNPLTQEHLRSIISEEKIKRIQYDAMEVASNIKSGSLPNIGNYSRYNNDSDDEPMDIE